MLFSYPIPDSIMLLYEVMVRNIFLISILLLIPSISYAEIGDVYYCESVKESVLVKDDLTTFTNSKFKFKRYKKKIMVEGGNFGTGLEMDVNFDNGAEYFAGVYGESIAIFLYEKDIFMFTMLTSSDGKEHRINNVYANCSIFK